MPPEASPEVRTDALRLLTNGVYVLTACLGETIHAATVTWVTQVSFEPPLLLVALRRNSRLAQSIRKAHRFALNVLDEEQQALAERFFQHVSVTAETADLGGFTYRPSPQHCPLLTGAAAWLECRLAAEPTAPGDHNLLVGEVVSSGVRHAVSPMVLWQTPWAYGGVQNP